MKWFPKLTKEEFLAWWQTYDSKIDDKIKIQIHNNFAMVHIWEYGWGDFAESLSTEYQVTDFKIEPWEVYESAECENTRNASYVAFMAKKFGRPYIADLLHSYTGIPTLQWLTILQKNCH